MMSLLPLKRSATLVAQCLISGRVCDTLFDAPPGPGLRVELADWDTGAPYPLQLKLLPDGSFAFYGMPDSAFPLLATQAYHLRVTARAPTYEPDDAEVLLAATAGQPALVTRDLPAGLDLPAMQVRLFTSVMPIADLALELVHQPVRLRGRVIRLDAAGEGVAGATVVVTSPNGPPDATTDAEGRFEFSAPLPVEKSISLDVSATDYVPRQLTYEPDYSQPVNSLVIGLMQQISE